MRILLLDAGREMRGGQWQALRLMDGLTAEGVETTLLARAEAPLYDAARRRGLRVEPWGVVAVARLARQHDLAHAQDARSHTLAALAGGAPLVVSRRVAFPVGSRWKYARPARYIAVSEFVKRTLVAGGVPPEKIAVVYDGVPLLDVSRGSSVLAPGNIGDPQKGAPLAAEAARLAGVEIHFARDLERELSGAAVFLYVTHSEGLGSGALLAMSAGVPVIASNVGGLPEIVRPRETGLLVENEPVAIAGALVELRDNPALARELGARARRAVEERFTVGGMVQRTMEVYRQVLS